MEIPSEQIRLPILSEKIDCPFLLKSASKACPMASCSRIPDAPAPITTGIWNQSLKEQNEFLLANCDIITFHCYQSASETEKFTHRMRASGRPVICTEWMNRCVKSTVKDCLPVFERTRTGCMLWGLVWGKSQTHLPWGWRPEKGPYKGVWQCNLFRVDHTPYDPAEIALLSEAVGRANP